MTIPATMTMTRHGLSRRMPAPQWWLKNR
jgi:hypothetical protein